MSEIVHGIGSMAFVCATREQVLSTKSTFFSAPDKPDGVSVSPTDTKTIEVSWTAFTGVSRSSPRAGRKS